MSDSDAETVTEFKCRKCDKTFTAAEKDAHRLEHKKKKRPGPASKRDLSPSIFDAVPREPRKPERSTRRSEKRSRGKETKTEEPQPAAKRRSNKNYDSGVIGGWSKGTGA